MGVVPTAIFMSSSGLLLYIPTCNNFEWTPYFDLTIQECIPFEFLVNPNIWHVKAPQDIEDLYHIDLRERTNEHWPTFHAQYINIWDNRVHGKPYLLVEEARDRQLHTRKLRQAPRHLMSGASVEMSLLSTLTQEAALIAVPPLGFLFEPPSPVYYTLMPSMFQMMTDSMLYSYVDGVVNTSGITVLPRWNIFATTCS
ncbi:hypothetical protein CXB51_001414 [Gossypium anomalum]|uniref:Aminotransferase-like plant mobile domain-containing protein n=1 Tax=Gossypium anomalum TaxID=47600 RepID=A0A8J5ZK27_9ROSI|nr:hypothetical protein CXB51_001414 [Gossypium anomalum]